MIKFDDGSQSTLWAVFLFPGFPVLSNVDNVSGSKMHQNAQLNNSTPLFKSWFPQHFRIQSSWIGNGIATI